MENENFADKVKELAERRDGIISELQRLIGPYKAEQVQPSVRPFCPKVVFTRVREVRAPEIDGKGRILIYPAAIDEDRTTVYSGVKICLPEGIGVIFTRVDDGDKSRPCGILLPGDHNELTFDFGPSEVDPGPADGPLATPFARGTFFRIPDVSLEETLNSVFQDFADGKISG